MINKLLKRTSIRDYQQDREIPKYIKDKLIEIINSSPTAINSSSFSAIIIERKEVREKLFEMIGSYITQKHLVDASMFVLFCVDLNRLKYSAEKNNLDINDTNIDLFTSAVGDAFIASTLLMTAAIDYGLGTCFIGSVRMTHEYLKKELNLEGNIIPVVGLVLGYPTKINELKPKQNRVFIDKYDLNLVKKEVDSYDEIMKEYFATRETNYKVSTWSSQLATIYSKKDFDLVDQNYNSLPTFKKRNNNI